MCVVYMLYRQRNKTVHFYAPPCITHQDIAPVATGRYTTLANGNFTDVLCVISSESNVSNVDVARSAAILMTSLRTRSGR